MSETILNGYLINKSNYQVFDEIITFITPDNERISCISLGSRKIESKNGRNLFLGNFNEFQIFRSRANDKLSKLKKTVCLSQLNFKVQNNSAFLLLNECVNLAPPHTLNLFNFYKNNLENISDNIFLLNEMFLIILMRYIKLLGLDLEVNHCVICGSKKLKTISFQRHGMLCELCIDKNKDKIFNIDINKGIHFLFNEKFDELNKYSHCHLFLIDLIKAYIRDNCGITLRTTLN